MAKTATAVMAAAAVMAATAPVVVPAAVAMAGFGTAGIVGGSWAAAFMSTYGGAVSAGSLCAVMQSIGAAGLATSTVAACEAAAATASLGAAAAFFGCKGKSDDQPARTNSTNADVAAAEELVDLGPSSIEEEEEEEESPSST